MNLSSQSLTVSKCQHNILLIGISLCFVFHIVLEIIGYIQRRRVSIQYKNINHNSV